MAGPANRCLLADGITIGDVVFVTAYLSNQPIAADGTSQTPTPQNWLELGNMSVADAQSTSVYIGLLWAMVWGFKQVARSLINRERDVDE
jgi:hypothetical protein